MKTCLGCNILKQLDDFHAGTARHGRKSRCKDCCRQNRLNKKWKHKNNYTKVSYQDMKCQQCDKTFKPSRSDNVYCSKQCGDRYNRNLRRDEINDYFRCKYKSDISRRLSACLRSRLNKALRGAYKKESTVNLLGCSPAFLKKHLEAQFQPGMSWDNYGKWHIDHIEPLAGFNLSDINQLKHACHYTNLQPLWAYDNLSKGAKYEKH